MFTMSFEENKDFWESFINLYRERPCLWEVKSKDYSNRNMRNSAYNELIEKCKDINQNTDKAYVLKKINSLRASFRRQFRKIQEAKSSTGNAAENVPEPTLWYYDLLLFTLDQDEVRSGLSSLKPRENVGEIEDIIEDTADSLNSSLETTSPQPLSSTTASTGTPHRKRSGAKQNISWAKKRNELADVVSHFLKDEGDEPANDCTTFGKSVGLELEMVSDFEQRDIAKKLISDTLFLAKRRKLTCDSRIEVEQFNPYLQPIPPSTSQFQNPYSTVMYSVRNSQSQQQQSQPQYSSLTSARTYFSPGLSSHSHLTSAYDQSSNVNARPHNPTDYQTLTSTNEDSNLTEFQDFRNTKNTSANQNC